MVFVVRLKRGDGKVVGVVGKSETYLTAIEAMHRYCKNISSHVRIKGATARIVLGESTVFDIDIKEVQEGWTGGDS